MIRFFRKIRSNLLQENRFLRYGLYALGEILLVVIGILFALQIDKWNDQAERREKEQVLLTQLQEDLFDIQSDLRNDLGAIELGQKSHFELTELMQADAPYQDTLCFAFAWLVYDDYIYPRKSTFENIKAEGMDIIRNENIRNLTQTLFEALFPRISKGIAFTPDIKEYFDPYYRRHFEPNEDTTLIYSRRINQIEIDYPFQKVIDGRSYPVTFGYVPLDFEALKKDPEFKVMMKKAQGFRTAKISRYYAAVERVDRLIDLIDEELKPE